MTMHRGIHRHECNDQGHQPQEDTTGQIEDQLGIRGQFLVRDQYGEDEREDNVADGDGEGGDVLQDEALNGERDKITKLMSSRATV